MDALVHSGTAAADVPSSRITAPPGRLTRQQYAFLSLMHTTYAHLGVRVSIVEKQGAQLRIGSESARHPGVAVRSSSSVDVLVHDSVHPPRRPLLETVAFEVGSKLRTLEHPGTAGSCREPAAHAWRRETTSLEQLRRELVAAGELDAVCRMALAKASWMLDLAYGEICFTDHRGRLTGDGAATGTVTSALHAVVREVAAAAAQADTVITLDTGEAWSGRTVEAPVVAVPLTPQTATPILGASRAVLVLVPRLRLSAHQHALIVNMGARIAEALPNLSDVGAGPRGTWRDPLRAAMEDAAVVQRQLLPVPVADVPQLEVNAVCRAATGVSGDYFDLIRHDDGSVTALVADVAGHGMGSGLIMAMTRTAFRCEAGRRSSLAAVLQEVNAVMWDDLVATGLYVTLFCVRYDPSSGILSYVNAGHHPALLRRAGGQVRDLHGDGYPMGVVPMPDFEVRTVQLFEHDAVLLFTDGVIEESGANGVRFGAERLTSTVAEAASDILTRVLESVDAFRGTRPQTDDMTLLELRRLPLSWETSR